MTEIDVDHQVNAARRAVGARVLGAGEANVVTISRAYATDPADLWDACTNPERIPRWFLPVSGELELGGTYQLEGNASGTILSCDPPNEFTATWEFGGQVSWIEVRITAENDGARLELDHIAHVDDGLWDQFGPGAVGIGWDLGLLGLGMHLASGEAVPPGFEAQFSASDNGRRFVVAVSQQWQAASAAFGTAPEAASAAADRCTAFYLGEAEPQN